MFVYLTIISRIETIVLILQVLVPGSYYSTLGKVFFSPGYETNSKSERKNSLLILAEGHFGGTRTENLWGLDPGHQQVFPSHRFPAPLSPPDHGIWNPKIQSANTEVPHGSLQAPLEGSSTHVYSFDPLWGRAVLTGTVPRILLLTSLTTRLFALILTPKIDQAYFVFIIIFLMPQ